MEVTVTVLPLVVEDALNVANLSVRVIAPVASVAPAPELALTARVVVSTSSSTNEFRAPAAEPVFTIVTVAASRKVVLVAEVTCWLSVTLAAATVSMLIVST
jgi:hypothetical protein